MTNTNIEIFSNEEFGEVRAVVIDGSPWFVGKDVAIALGFANTKDAILSHVDAEDRQILQRSAQATFEIPNRGLTIVNESGLYSLILSCQLPKGKRFKKWITSEVLPSLRKNGIYITDPLMKKIAENPEYINSLWATLYKQGDKIKVQGQAIEVRDGIISTQEELIDVQESIINNQEHIIYMQDVELCELEEEVADKRWKAEYYDKHVAENDGVPVRVLAKQLEMPEKKLVDILIGCRFLYRCGGHLLPYADARSAGLFRVREGGTLVTPKGKDKIFKLLEALRLDAEAAV